MNLNRKKNLFCLSFTLFCLICSGEVSVQFYSVCTNIVGLATGNINIEGFMALSSHWSVHLPLQYNPFNLWNDGKLKNITVSPGVRYWMRETYGRGYFLGLHGVFSHFNAGGLFGHRYRYQGTALGGGISVGLVRPFPSLESGVWIRRRCSLGGLGAFSLYPLRTPHR